jgi:hypothetical protein
MQKFKYTLPDMEHSFEIQTKGEESQVNWVGKFLYKRPNLRERAAIDVMFRRLNGDLVSLDPDVQALNEALSFLRFTLKSYPDWWKDSDFGGAIYDANVIFEVYSKCMNFEADWRKKVMGGNPEDVRLEDENTATKLSSEASPS